CAVAHDAPGGHLRGGTPGLILPGAPTGLPILPVAIAASRAKLLRSWDRFLVPLPFSTVHIVYGEPLIVERRENLEAAAAELKRRLEGVEETAEVLAQGGAGGVLPSPREKDHGDPPSSSG